MNTITVMGRRAPAAGSGERWPSFSRGRTTTAARNGTGPWVICGSTCTRPYSRSMPWQNGNHGFHFQNSLSRTIEAQPFADDDDPDDDDPAADAADAITAVGSEIEQLWQTLMGDGSQGDD